VRVKSTQKTDSAVKVLLLDAGSVIVQSFLKFKEPINKTEPGSQELEIFESNEAGHPLSEIP